MKPVQSSAEFSRDFILNESNRCVSCGLCVPHCPTYRLLKTEADSPRGRINLMNGVASGRIPLTERFAQHMDRCLTCRACESVCPNNVAYGRLIDEARTMVAASELSQSRQAVASWRLKVWVMLEEVFIAQPVRLDRVRWLFRALQKNRLMRWLSKTDFFERNELVKFITRLPLIGFPYPAMADQDNSDDAKWKEIYPAKGKKKRGDVGLFLGCVARITDVATLNAGIHILNHLGYTVHVPSTQTCCGALYQHGGQQKIAAELAQKNNRAFSKLGVSAIISTASGCGVQLVESGVGGCNLDKDWQVLSTVTDISKFLVTAEGWEDVEILPLTCKVAVHDPCSLRNVLGDQAYVYELISRIPGVQVVPLPGNDQCCGAAGIYFIDQPELAGMLRADKITALKESAAHYLVTSNVGCSMYLAAGVNEMRISVEVLHPVTLLARQMGL